MCSDFPQLHGDDGGEAGSKLFSLLVWKPRQRTRDSRKHAIAGLRAYLSETLEAVHTPPKACRFREELNGDVVNGTHYTADKTGTQSAAGSLVVVDGCATR